MKFLKRAKPRAVQGAVSTSTGAYSPYASKRRASATRKCEVNPRVLTKEFVINRPNTIRAVLIVHANDNI